MINVFKKPLVFCDVETTGSVAAYSRITEIACIRYENGKEVDRLVTLLNPAENIPYEIQRITGITNQIVQNEPFFEDIADRVEEIFDGAILVAHNAKFDYAFIKKEMERVGKTFKHEMLCTAQLSKRLFPEYKSHNLSALIERHGFICRERHRALGDTEVLVQFAVFVEQEKTEEEILSGSKHKGLQSIPPNLDPEFLKDLPHTPGVYSFFGKNGELLYVGKSKDIKSRVLSHFTNSLNNSKTKKMWEEMYDIAFTETASDLGASLLELYKIKTEFPFYNRLSRKVQSLWYLQKYENKDGYVAFELKKSENLNDVEFENIYGVFRTKRQAIESLNFLAKEQKFCPYLLGIEKIPKNYGACFSSQLGLCSGACSKKIDKDIYNLKVEIAFKEKKLRTWPYDSKKVILKKNVKSEMREKFVVDNWILQSAEIVYGENEPKKLFPVKEELFDYDMYKILFKYIFR
jgi:DNA polymerase-3 subunit epsilon